MAGFYNEMERVIGVVSDNSLEVALHYYGQELTQLRIEKDNVYAKVHSKNAGGDLHKVRCFDGILQSDDFSSSDGNYSANFEEGFLYTKEKDVLVGDVIKVNSGGGIRKFRVEAREDIGYSTDMFVKFRLSNQN